MRVQRFGSGAASRGLSALQTARGFAFQSAAQPAERCAHDRKSEGRQRDLFFGGEDAQPQDWSADEFLQLTGLPRRLIMVLTLRLRSPAVTIASVSIQPRLSMTEEKA